MEFLVAEIPLFLAWSHSLVPEVRKDCWHFCESSASISKIKKTDLRDQTWHYHSTREKYKLETLVDYRSPIGGNTSGSEKNIEQKVIEVFNNDWSAPDRSWQFWNNFWKLKDNLIACYMFHPYVPPVFRVLHVTCSQSCRCSLIPCNHCDNRLEIFSPNLLSLFEKRVALQGSPHMVASLIHRVL